MSARLFKRGSIWYAWVGRTGGGTVKVSTNCTDRKAAEKRAGELEREALDPANAAANRATTLDACTEFLRSRQRRGRADGTLHHYRIKLGHVIRLMPKRLGDVDAAACERFIEQRLEEGAAQTTVKKEIRALGATLRHARRQGLYLRDVEAVVPELEETYKPRERALTPWELVGLANSLPTERAAHVAFIVVTGARWSESVRARLEDVVGSMVLLRGTKTERALRTVPVPPSVRGALAWSLANAPGETPLFAPWANVRRDLAKACLELGIAAVTPNDLRRTFGTWLRQSGVTPDLIGMAMGHTTGRMAERVYGRIGPADLDRLITERGPALLLEETNAADDSDRDNVRAPDGDRNAGGAPRREGAGGLLLRRKRERLRRTSRKGPPPVVRVREAEGSSRGDQGDGHAGVSDLGGYEEPVQESDERGLPLLRGSRDQGLPTMGELPELPQRHGPAAEPGALDRPHRQRRELRAGERPVGDQARAVAQPAAAPETLSYPDRHGMHMGGDVAETGLSKGSTETPESDETSCFPSARGRNRTADTGIFNPGGVPVNADGSSDSAHTWAANGLTFGARARRWLMRVAA